MDNLDNLAAPVVEWLTNRYAGTRLGQQELEGILVDDVDGALWTRELLDSLRISAGVRTPGDPISGDVWRRADGTEWRVPPFWQATVLAIDPSDGLEEGDEQGLAIVSHSPDDQGFYVRHVEGNRLTPWAWLNRVADLAIEYDATVIMEKNHGGEYLVGLFQQVLDKRQISVPYGTVDAGSSKMTRAEQVAALYEQGRVHHLGFFPHLEDQQCTFTGLGKEPSPDQMDALVWAMSRWVNVAMRNVPDEWNDDRVVQHAIVSQAPGSWVAQTQPRQPGQTTWGKETGRW